MSLTFQNFRKPKLFGKEFVDGGQIMVLADCVENGQEAYAMVPAGKDEFARAAEKLAGLS